ncbi:O-antigen ligase family protein [Sphingobium sp. TKS]|uniref:O-antigen ligase family protein n=1 Tax=Sphingobium sp. TKS TaxID=1315974 RepID=UPI00076FE53E|nr:O-antigen ligase family protein [Sphingobium sp. TKS]AMK25206.1 O-antigen ligase WaaL [Sphingobium sp. TKS]
MSPGARRVSLRSPQISAPILANPPAQAGSGFSVLVAVAVLLPFWIPRPLMTGELSFAFAMPFILAFWALTQPAWPGSFRRALHGRYGRGLWLEALCVCVVMMMAFMSMLVSPVPLRAFRVILPMTYAICALILFSRMPSHLQRRMVFALLFSGVLVFGIAIGLSQTGWGRSIVMRDYRFLAFFEKPNQLGVAVMAVWPLSIALLLNARTAMSRLLCTIMLLVLATAIFMSGTKTALALGFVSAALTWLYHGSRSGSLDKTLFKLSVILCGIAFAVPATLWVLSWASPDFFRRVNSILTYGLWEFPSMQTRDMVWKESIQIGLDHPLLGEGAGTRVYRYAHSHNMFLDYFRGMGVFGLAAAVALVLSAVSRGANFLLATLPKGQVDRESDTIVAGMYLGAIFYLIGNQLSDSFSPTTAFLFWIMYLGAYFTAPPLNSVARPPLNLVKRPVGQPSTSGWAPRARRPGSNLQDAAQPV